MNYAELEDYEKLEDTATEDDWWQALIALEPHLDDVFIEVDAVTFERGAPSRLITFRTPQDQLCYVAVTESGDVILGRIRAQSHHSLGLYIQQPLGDFDPQRDEIRSIAVTDLHRYTGDTLDLWVMVRRLPPRTTRPPNTACITASSPWTARNTWLCA